MRTCALGLQALQSVYLLAVLWVMCLVDRDLRCGIALVAFVRFVNLISSGN